jgi:hypothetical protein
MIVTTPAERATPQAMASYGILKDPSSSDRNDEKKSSMADMSGFLPLDAAGILQLCNGRINSHVPIRSRHLWMKRILSRERFHAESRFSARRPEPLDSESPGSNVTRPGRGSASDRSTAAPRSRNRSTGGTCIAGRGLEARSDPVPFFVVGMAATRASHRGASPTVKPP